MPFVGCREQQRIAVSLRYGGGYPVAAGRDPAHGLSEGAVKAHLHAARAGSVACCRRITMDDTNLRSVGR